MCLQLNGRGIELSVKRPADIPRFTLQLKVILHQHAIEEDSDIRWSYQRAIGIEDRSSPYYVVGLPFSGLAIRID